MGRPLEVLLVQGRENDETLIALSLGRGGYDPRISRVETADELCIALAAGPWDAILSDDALPHFGCDAALQALRNSGREIPFIALSSAVNEETILTLLRAGACDCVTKENLSRLPSAIEREIREAEHRRQCKRLEALLQQTAKMEAIGRMAGAVAHDFNNLLTVISGFAQLALNDDNPARAGLEQIMLAAERASALARQLLAVSRRQTLEPRVFDLNLLVGDMEKILRRLIGEEIDVITSISGGSSDVKADPGQIEQVVLNLALNARDSMPKGGKLVVGTFRCRMDSGEAMMHGLPEGDYCAVSVRDTGCGITQEALPHIFDPFFTTKPEGLGTGLGLSTVYGIMKQSGGAVHACSEAGVGTTMTVFLPASSTRAALTAVSKTAPVAGKETVLVAEDDRMILSLISHCLKARGFSVLLAENGESALELLHARGPAGVDLLITDVVMPEISGPVLAVRAAELLPGLKVLFMSGYPEEVVWRPGISRRNSCSCRSRLPPASCWARYGNYSMERRRKPCP